VDKDVQALFADSNKEEKKRPLATRVTDQEVQAALVKKIDERSVAWVIGTSLGFELVTVGLAAFIFRRRDF
jgi:hypothetical protein